MNYYDTLFEIADDSPATEGQVPRDDARAAERRTVFQG
jgi:hypothetical protein